MEIFRVRGLPDCLIVGDYAGELWMVPAIANGWAHRTRYACDPLIRDRLLTPAPRELGDRLGLPLNGFADVVTRLDSDEAPAQRRATRPTKTPPGRRSGLRRPKSLRV